MVEIGVYSTVGALEVSCRNSAEFSAQSAAKMRWKSVETAEERAKNGVKDVVKMVAVCALKKFPRTEAEKFGTIQSSTR